MKQFPALICVPIVAGVLILTGVLIAGLIQGQRISTQHGTDPPAQVYPPPLVSQPGLLMAGPYRKSHRRTIRYRIMALHYTSNDEPMHLNDRGDILCGTDFYHGGKWTRLKPKFTDSTYNRPEVYGLNDSGIVGGDLAGDSSGAYTIYYSEAVVWQNGQMRVLPDHPPAELAPVAINNRGDIIATTVESADDPAQDPEKAYFYSQGKFNDLGAGNALCFNDKDQIVLQATPYSGFTLWENGRSRPLGVKFGTPSFINNRGQIAGALATNQPSHEPYYEVSHAFFWEQGRTRDLGTLGGDDSVALGLNSSGEVVGKAEAGPPNKAGVAPTHAFLWRNGRMSDLNDLIPARSGWVLSEADAVNDRGWIVCAGNRGACLLTPR